MINRKIFCKSGPWSQIVLVRQHHRPSSSVHHSVYGVGASAAWKLFIIYVAYWLMYTQTLMLRSHC